MLKHDVLLIGGGGAGLRAAIAVAEKNPELSVAVVSKVYPMQAGTSGHCTVIHSTPGGG